MSVEIVTDSASDLQQEEANELGITVLPIKTFIDGDEYYDGVTITTDEFNDKFEKAKEVPRTSQIPPAHYEVFLKPLVENDKDIVLITLGSGLSGTHQSARIAADELGGNIYVVDSESVTIGQQLLVKLAQQLKEQGLSAKEIAEELEKQKKRIHVVASVDTLKYLQKGGRISKTAALAGTMLNIKPVLDVNDNKVEVVAKPRGAKKSADTVTKKIKEYGGIDFDLPVMLAYSGKDDSSLQNFLDKNKDLFEGKLDEIPVANIGATIMTHAGPGAYAVAFFADED